jgi:GDP-L-fucose synthase
MQKHDKIYVAGHQGMAGSAIVRRLRDGGYENVFGRSRHELDLTDQAAVNRFFAAEKPDIVFLAAAKVGGIHANSTYPADFILTNLQIQTNVIDAAWRNGARKLMFLGSSCIYPRLAPQPIPESALLTGPLEPTNEWYAVAKIAGIKLCDGLRRQHGFNAIAVMPTNLYGPGDNFHPENAHAVPALIRRFCEAKEEGRPEVVIWGSGQPRREFLHVDDFADAAVFLMETYEGEDFVNIGAGDDITIRELAEMIRDAVGYDGRLVFDETKPDGVPRKLLDTSRLTDLRWSPQIPLCDGIRVTYAWFRQNRTGFRA